MGHCVPRATLLLQLLCSACVCLYTPGPTLPSQTNTPAPSKCSLRVEPPELVVRFGDPVSVNCSYSRKTFLGWEGLPVDTEAGIASFLPWIQTSLSSWSFKPMCYALAEVGQCVVSLPVTVYQPPEWVSLTFKNHTGTQQEEPSGPLAEGGLYTLLCEVGAVAPAQNMTVAFYRGHRELGAQSSRTPLKTPVDESFSLNYTVSREDHGAHFWCEVRLELGPEGPQPPPVVRSQRVTANVHVLEEQVEAPPTRSSREHVGRATVSAQSQRGQRQPPEVTGSVGAGHAPGSNAFILMALLLIHATHWL